MAWAGQQKEIRVVKGANRENLRIEGATLIDALDNYRRAFGDFEADPKRSDSEPIPDREVCFLAFICSLNTFQSKNPTYTLSSLHFQLDEKRGKRAQNLKRRLSNPVLRYKYERREDFENFGSSFQRQKISSGKNSFIDDDD